MSITPRFNRLFAPDGKCFEIAVDHGVHNEPAFLSGIENMEEAIVRLVEAAPDAILLSPGQAPLLQRVPGKAKPALTLRADPTNLYGEPTPRQVFCQLLDEIVERALVLDAASIVVNLLWTPDQPELYQQCVRNISRIKRPCEQWGIPLMVEPLAMRRLEPAGGYRPDAEIGRNVALVRQAVELGADIVKAESFENLEAYHKIIEAASGKPVLPRGGSRIPDREILRRTHELIRQGASGIVYGRNIFQNPRPLLMAKACHAIVHGGASLEEAVRILDEPPKER